MEYLIRPHLPASCADVLPTVQVVRALRFDGVKIPEGYERRVQRALWTFKHQRVYCPRRRAAVHLHEVVGGELAAGARVPAAAQVRQGGGANVMGS